MATTDRDAMLWVLQAAEDLLAARENQMLTAEEWDALQHAVAAARQPASGGEGGREESFSIRENILIQSVKPARGTPYDHTCDQETFENVTHAIDQLGGGSFTGEEIREELQAPFTQVAVAIAFLKERGCIVPSVRKRSVAATSDVHCDAMIEWHALREKGGDQS